MRVTCLKGTRLQIMIIFYEESTIIDQSILKLLHRRSKIQNIRSVTDQEKDVSFLDEMSIAAAQLVHLSRLKKRHVFFLIGNRPIRGFRKAILKQLNVLYHLKIAL